MDASLVQPVELEHAHRVSVERHTSERGVGWRTRSRATPRRRGTTSEEAGSSRTAGRRHLQADPGITPEQVAAGGRAMDRGAGFP